MSAYTERHARSFGGWLIVFAVGYAVLHHAGTLFVGLGDVGPTRWADWVDLLTPYVVTGAAVGALRGAGAARGVWAAFWFAAVVYTQGHAIHLAANSVGNTIDGPHPDVVNLWDEVVGHYLWYVGFGLLVAVLAVALADRRPRGGVGAHLLALLVGLTNMTNSVEGQTPWLGLAMAVLFTLWGLVTRDGMGRYLLTAYGFSLVLLTGFGLWQGGFPEFSELGWI
ncbi:MAG: hypothetical protein H0U35_14465 [Sporichthyaceae bacterium]|nr:hypothetical protein [Sporichthyaceae bacterium]